MDALANNAWVVPLYSESCMVADEHRIMLLALLLFVYLFIYIIINRYHILMIAQ